MTTSDAVNEDGVLDLDELSHPKDAKGKSSLSEMEFVGVEDLAVRREDGKLVPFDVLTPLSNLKVRMTPLSYGESKAYQLRTRVVSNLSDEEKLMILRKHIVIPDLSNLTMEEMQEWDWAQVDDLLTAVVGYSRASVRMKIPDLVRTGEEDEPGE